jgi:hypothetical protein
MLSVRCKVGDVPFVETAPTIAFIPKSAALLAGWVIDPSVSVAIVRGAKPAARPAALPDDDPAGAFIFVSSKQMIDELRVLEY